MHRFVVGCLVMCAVVAVGSRGNAADLRADWLAEYEEPARRLQEHYRAVRARYHFHQQFGPDRKVVTTATLICDRENARCEGEAVRQDAGGRVAGEPRRTIQVRNRLYHFDLLVQGERGYVLQTAVSHAERPESWGFVLFPIADVAIRRTYLDVFRDEETRIHVVKREVWRGRSVVTIDTEMPFRHPVTKQTTRARALYSFDPTTGWACVGERAVAANPSDTELLEQIYHYTIRDGWPVPTRAERWIRKVGDAGSGECTSVTVIDEYVPVPPPDEAQFRLSAFGLPEPVGVEWPKKSTAWVWLVAGVAGFAVAAVGFRRLTRMAAPKT